MEFDSAYSTSNFTEADNLSCAARNIQGPVMLPYSLSLTTTVRSVQSMLFFVVILAGVSLNTMVILLVAKHKRLQTLSFLIALQIVVLDLLIALMLLISLVSSIANEWLFGESVCAIYGLFISAASLVRTLLMFVFVVDRYLSVFWPFFYPKHKIKLTVSLSVAAWVFCLLVTAAMLPGLLDCYTFVVVGWVCFVSSTCSSLCLVYARLFYTIAVPFIVVPIFLYARLYYLAKKLRKESQDTSASDNQRRELKSVVTFSLLFITVLAVTLPSLTISLILRVLSRDGEFSAVSYVLIAICSSILSLLVVTDPVVIMRNKDMKEIISKIKDRAMKNSHHSPDTADS